MPNYLDEYQIGQLDVEPDFKPAYDAYNCDALAGGDKGCGVNDVSQIQLHNRSWLLTLRNRSPMTSHTARDSTILAAECMLVSS